MANDVRITLTDEQKAKIKEATGKDLGEIRVGNLGNNPAVTPTSSAKMPAARVRGCPRTGSPGASRTRGSARAASRPGGSRPGVLASRRLASRPLASRRLASRRLASRRLASRRRRVPSGPRHGAPAMRDYPRADCLKFARLHGTPSAPVRRGVRVLESPGDWRNQRREDPEAFPKERAPVAPDLRQPLEPGFRLPSGFSKRAIATMRLRRLRRPESAPRGRRTESAETRGRSRRSCRGGSGTAPAELHRDRRPDARSVRSRSDTGNRGRQLPRVADDSEDGPRGDPPADEILRPCRQERPSIGLGRRAVACCAASRARPAAAAPLPPGPIDVSRHLRPGLRLRLVRGRLPRRGPRGRRSRP